MILIFHVPPLARGQELCDIDSLIYTLYSPEKFRRTRTSNNLFYIILDSELSISRIRAL